MFSSSFGGWQFIIICYYTIAVDGNTVRCIDAVAAAAASSVSIQLSSGTTI